MGALPRLIAHHPSTTVLLVDALVVGGVLAVLVTIGWRERRRRGAGRVARMREPD